MKSLPAAGRPAGSAYGLVDVTLRDGHQCLWSTRMTTPMMTPILGAIDRVGYRGGRTRRAGIQCACP